MSGPGSWSPDTEVAAKPARWFASEWSLAILALVLAILVWAVVWREIAAEAEIRNVALDLETSGDFEAFYEGTVHVTLQGPQGELEAARRALGEPPVLRVRIPDLTAGEDHREIPITRDMMGFPFPVRLVASMGAGTSKRLPAADVYRRREQTVTFLQPQVRGVPLGVGTTVRMEPRTMPIVGPAGKLGGPRGEIVPDEIDLAAYFPEGLRDLPGETRIRLAFDDWRSDAQTGRFRRGVELPPVEAVLNFSYEATREIANRLLFDIPPEYEVRADLTERYTEGRYQGLFEGRARDLDSLERSADAWWFVVRVPSEKLPAEGEEAVTEGLVEFFHAASLDGLNVRLASREILVLTLKRRDAP